MEESPIYEKLTSIVNMLFLRNDITLSSTTSARDINCWDSLRHIEILMAAEQAFGIQFSSKELDNISSVGGLVELIHLRTKEKTP